MEQHSKWLLDFGARIKAEREKQGITQQARKLLGRSSVVFDLLYDIINT